MSGNVAKSVLTLLVTAGCAGRPPRTPSLPIPASPPPAERLADNGPWAFSYRSDTMRIQINRSAAIESTTDSGAHREISTNNTHEILSLTVNADTIRYTATIDSFSTASQGLIGKVQPVSLPVQISGIIGSAAPADSSIQTCDPVQANLQGDVRSVLVNFPQQLTPGQSWRDSSTRFACYGPIPMATTVVRHFSVVGRTSFNNQSVVAIERTDSISARGEGRQQQHRVVVDVSGAGSGTYHLSTELGRVLHLTTSQDLDFTIRASGRTNRFRESAKEEFSLAP